MGDEIVACSRRGARAQGEIVLRWPLGLMLNETPGGKIVACSLALNQAKSCLEYAR
jgi:hypothetical protein